MMTRRNMLIAKQSLKTTLITWSSEMKPFGTFVGHEYGYGRDSASNALERHKNYECVLRENENFSFFN